MAQPIKSIFDKSSYSSLLLSNSMRCLLISNPGTSSILLPSPPPSSLPPSSLPPFLPPSLPPSLSLLLSLMAYFFFSSNWPFIPSSAASNWGFTWPPCFTWFVSFFGAYNFKRFKELSGPKRISSIFIGKLRESQ